MLGRLQLHREREVARVLRVRVGVSIAATARGCSRTGICTGPDRNGVFWPRMLLEALALALSGTQQVKRFVPQPWHEAPWRQDPMQMPW